MALEDDKIKRGGVYFRIGDRVGWVAQKVTFWVPGVSKIFIFDRFYKVSRHGAIRCDL